MNIYNRSNIPYQPEMISNSLKAYLSHLLIFGYKLWQGLLGDARNNITARGETNNAFQCQTRGKSMISEDVFQGG